jgi:hypothetical protein
VRAGRVPTGRVFFDMGIAQMVGDRDVPSRVRESFVSEHESKERRRHMIERIISRGVPGAELEALKVARVCGLRTGGATRIHRCKRSAHIIRRYGLSTDHCSRRQALLRNQQQADGTLIFGRPQRVAIQPLERWERAAFRVTEQTRWTPRAIARWVRRHNIRTLNVVQAWNWPSLQPDARELLLEVLYWLGQSPSRPQRSRTQVVFHFDWFYAVALWPRQRVWEWDEAAARWRGLWDPRRPYPIRGGRLFGRIPVERDWRKMSALRSVAGNPPRLWRLLPQRLRGLLVGPDDAELDVLEAISRLGKPAEDLARAGRWALLKMIANARQYLPGRRARWNVMRRLIRCRQRDIMAVFGFPATESAVRTLAKVPLKSCFSGELIRVRNLLTDRDASTVLQRLPSINRAAVGILSDPWSRRVCSRQLLRFAAENDDTLTPDQPGNVCSHLHCLHEEAKRTGRVDQIKVVRSMRHLHELIDELRALPDVSWPPPPSTLFGITGLIEPLETAKALKDEGRAMGHCVAAYNTKMVNRQSLLFRVLADPRLGTTRATLELRPGPNGQWQVEQLAGRSNTPVSTSTARLVETWRELAHLQPPLAAAQLEQTCREKLATALASRHAA